MNDRRHELETNELAVYLDKANRQIEPYSKLIAAVVAALLIGGLIWAFVSNQAVEVRSDSTLELLQASGSSDPEVFDAVTSRCPRQTLSARWASLYQGNEYLGQGIEALYNDRENAEQLLGDCSHRTRSVTRWGVRPVAAIACQFCSRADCGSRWRYR